MSPLAVAVTALVLAIAVAGVVFVSPLLAVPFVLIAIAGVLGLQVLRRQRRASDMRQFREQAAPQQTEFTAEDRRTQVRTGAPRSGSSPGERGF